MGFKRLNFSLKVLIKTGSFMRVSSVPSKSNDGDNPVVFNDCKHRLTDIFLAIAYKIKCIHTFLLLQVWVFTRHRYMLDLQSLYPFF